MSIMRILRIVLKYVFLPILAICIIDIIALLAFRAHMQRKNAERTRITAPNGISSLEKITIGGIEQWILIRGWDRSNPVLLFLHGGPGGGEIPNSRDFYPMLERDFVFVNWDQRGAGKSYSASVPPESMTIDRIVEDTRELTEMLVERFDVPRIYLVGHSWGSMLGAIAAARYPELFYAFIGVGQDVHCARAEEIPYQFVLDLASETDNQEAMKELREIGPPPYEDFREMWRQRRWLEEFNGVFHIPVRTDFWWWMGAMSPDSVLADAIRYDRGLEFSSEVMWNEVNRADLFRDAPKIDIPVYFFLGRYDYNTPFELGVEYYKKLESPKGKEIIWFEYSAHMIPLEEPAKFHDMLVNRVLKETYPIVD